MHPLGGQTPDVSAWPVDTLNTAKGHANEAQATSTAPRLGRHHEWAVRPLKAPCGNRRVNTITGTVAVTN